MFKRDVSMRALGVRRAVLALVTGSLLAAAPAWPAPSGFAFLEVPAGARASALGGAVVSNGTGVEAAFWNPAGLASIDRVEIGGSHDEFFQNLRNDRFVASGRQLGGAVALSVRALYSEPIEARDELGNLTGTFGGQDLEFGLAYGRTITTGVRAGVSAQLVRERIADLSAGTWSMGAGVGYDPARWPSLKLGLSVDHLGPAAHYDFPDGPGQDIPLPAAMQAGATYSFGLPGAMGLGTSLEARATRGRAAVGMAGAELTHPSGAAVRLGVRVNDPASSVSMGAGYGSRGFHLDYAFVPYRLDLGDTHRISFTARF